MVEPSLVKARLSSTPVSIQELGTAAFESFEACGAAREIARFATGGRRFDPDQLHQVIKSTGPIAQVVRAHP